MKKGVMLGWYLHINKTVKRYASFLGLAAFLISVILLQIGCSFLPNKVPVSSMNTYSGTLPKDWNLISESLDIPMDSKLENFEVEYNNDGLIRYARYEIMGYQAGRIKRFRIQLIPAKKAYQITSYDEDKGSGFDRLVEARRFFDVFSKLNLREMKPKQNYDFYVLRCYGSKVTYDMKAPKKFVIQNNRFISVANDQLPIEGYYISSYGMLKTEDTPEVKSYESKGQQDYFFDIEGQ